MGKVLFFNLGNNDLTTAEAVWALKSIMNRRSTLGLPNLLFYTMIGPFSHTTSNSYPNCQIYDHIDHYAIHDALFNYDLGMPTPSFQAAATCATDPDYQVNPRTAWVSSTAYVNPVTLQRVGFFQRDYGWMDWNEFLNDVKVNPTLYSPWCVEEAVLVSTYLLQLQDQAQQ